MMYLACQRCSEGKTEYEISILEKPFCRKCGGGKYFKAARPFTFKNWILHPFLLFKYRIQENLFNDLNYPFGSPLDEDDE